MFCLKRHGTSLFTCCTQSDWLCWLPVAFSCRCHASLHVWKTPSLSWLPYLTPLIARGVIKQHFDDNNRTLICTCKMQIISRPAELRLPLKPLTRQKLDSQWQPCPLLEMSKLWFHVKPSGNGNVVPMTAWLLSGAISCCNAFAVPKEANTLVPFGVSLGRRWAIPHLVRSLCSLTRDFAQTWTVVINSIMHITSFIKL